jgi:very-short-patch-repair endonuclease
MNNKKHSKETKLKISQACLGEKNGFYGKHHSEETKEKISNAVKLQMLFNNPMQGKHHSEETKQKIREKILGKKCSDKTKQKMSKVSKNKKKTKRHAENISKGLTGRKLSEEHKENLKKSKTGAHHSEETKEKISKATAGKNNPFYGKHHSEETKQKLSESVIAQKKDSLYWYSVGNNETKLLDEQEIKDNCRILRQYKIKKFSADGYCKETNTIYEVYEKDHKYAIKNDLIRQQKIQKYLKCNFIIIYDNWNDNKIEKFNYI